MKKLNESLLRLGDIILTTTDELDSISIRCATKSDISHAMLYVESHSVIDSTMEGVHARNTQRLFWEDNCAVHVLRYKTPLTDAQLRQIIDFARSAIGTRYSVLEAAKSVLSGRRSNSPKMFCSRLVAESYANAGISLVSNSQYCTPDELKSSSELTVVTDAILTGIDQTFAKAEVSNDKTQKMRNITNFLLNEARKKSNKIESINDIDRHLIANPADDSHFAELFQRSGYLDMWRSETHDNPWQYDAEIFDSIPHSDEWKLQYYELIFEDGDESLMRYRMNYSGYVQKTDHFHLSTFDLLKQLYAKLIALHKQRRNVVQQWVNHHYPNHSKPKLHLPLLMPHSKEWFDALHASNPSQAQQTQRLIHLAGNPDICSICGNKPANDFRRAEIERHSRQINTIKLCYDCWQIRHANFVESWMLMELSD